MKQSISQDELRVLDGLAVLADALLAAQRQVGQLAADVLAAQDDGQRACVLRWIELGARVGVEQFLADMNVRWTR